MHSRAREKAFIKHENLRFEELPNPGTLVAIDAEFVLMQQVRVLAFMDYLTLDQCEPG
jgi:hypothetical protein